jgi:hypothetical protein
VRPLVLGIEISLERLRLRRNAKDGQTVAGSEEMEMMRVEIAVVNVVESAELMLVESGLV